METYFLMVFPKIDCWPIFGPNQQFRTGWLKVTAVHGGSSVPFLPICSTHCTTLSPTGTLCTLQLLLSSSCPVATNREMALYQSGDMHKWVSEVKTSEYEHCDKGRTADNKADWCSWRRHALKGSTCCCLRQSAECLCICKVTRAAANNSAGRHSLNWVIVWNVFISDMDWARPAGPANTILHNKCSKDQEVDRHLSK